MNSNTRLIISLSLLAASIIGAVVGSGLIINQRLAQKELSESLVLHVALASTLDRFAVDHDISARDIALYGRVRSLAKPCTEFGNCMSLVEEWTGSSDYHTVPYEVRVTSGPGDVYLIVPAEVQYVEGLGKYYNPRLVVYHYGRGGVITKVMEDCTVYTNWFGGYERGWLETADKEYGRQFRALALQAAIAEGQAF